MPASASHELMRSHLLLLVMACRTSDPTCVEVADHAAELLVSEGQLATHTRQVILERCDQDVWAGSMRRCLIETTSAEQPRNCKAQLTTPQRTNLDRALAEVMREDAEREAAKVPESCTSYEAVLAELVKCEKLDRAVRDGLRVRFEDAKRGWGAIKDKSSLGAQCAAAITAVKQAGWECPGAARW